MADRRPYVFLVFATLFWAGNAIAGKLAVGHISPFLLTTLRWLAALLILWPFAAPHLRRDSQNIRSKLWFLFLLGTLGFAVFNNLFYLALNKTSAINVAIIQSALPLYIFVLNFALFRSGSTANQLLGFPLTVVGVFLIVCQGQWSILSQLQFNGGDVLMIIAVFAYAAYSVLINNKPNLHWLSLMSVLAVSAFVSSLPFSIYEVASHAVIWPDLTGLLVVLYTALFASILAQSFWIRGLEVLGANATGMFINLVPLQATLLAVFMLGEKLYMYHAVGMALILIGVFIAQSSGVFNRSSSRSSIH